MALTGQQEQMRALVYQRARDYALKQGANAADADAFARTSVAVAWTESNLVPAIQNRGGSPAYGLFQAYTAGGRGTGHSPEKLNDPEYNIALSLPELWQYWPQARGAGNAESQAVQMARLAQRPSEGDIQSAVRAGRFAEGAAIAGGAGGGMPGPPPAPAAAGIAEDPAKAGVFGTILSAAQKETGKRYAGPVIGEADAARWGDPGWDCSSFVAGAFRQVGISLTPFTDAAANETQTVDPNNALPGDIIFFKGAGSGGNAAAKNYHHMGIYLGNGKMIDAQYQGGVGIHDIASVGSPYEIRRHAEVSKQVTPEIAQAAVGLGQQVVTGKASAVPAGGAQAAGGTRMPATQTPSATSALRQGAYDDLTAAQAREKELRAKPEASLTPAEKDELSRLSDPDFGIPALRAAYLDFSKAERDEAKAGGGAGLSIADLITAQNQDFTNRFNVAQNDFTNRFNLASTAADMWNEGLTGQQNAAVLGFNILNSNRADVQKAVELAYERGRLDLNGATASVEAQAAQQAAQVGWAMEILKRAQFIDETNYRNAVRMLPPGTEYQPALEPNSALNQSLARLNLNPIIIRAAQVPTGQLAPERSLASGQATLEGSGLSLPQFDVAGVAAANERNRTLPEYMATPITPESVNVPQQFQNPVQLPSAPNLPQPPAAPFNYHDMIQALITGDSGGAATPPATDPKRVSQADASVSPERARFLEMNATEPQRIPPVAVPATLGTQGRPQITTTASRVNSFLQQGPQPGQPPAEPQIAQPPQAQVTPQPVGADAGAARSVLDPMTGEIVDTYPDGWQVRRRPSLSRA